MCTRHLLVGDTRPIPDSMLQRARSIPSPTSDKTSRARCTTQDFNDGILFRGEKPSDPIWQRAMVIPFPTLTRDAWESIDAWEAAIAAAAIAVLKAQK